MEEKQTKLIQTNFEDNHGVVVSGGNNHITIHINKDGVDIKKEEAKEEEEEILSPKERLAKILEGMESGHQMFCLFKGVLLAKKAASLQEAEAKLKEIFPEGIPGKKYDMHDIEFKIHVDSLAKPLEKWDIKDSPFRSQKAFKTYYNRTEQIRDLFLETDLLR